MAEIDVVTIGKACGRARCNSAHAPRRTWGPIPTRPANTGMCAGLFCLGKKDISAGPRSECRLVPRLHSLLRPAPMSHMLTLAGPGEDIVIDDGLTVNPISYQIQSSFRHHYFNRSRACCSRSASRIGSTTRSFGRFAAAFTSINVSRSSTRSGRSSTCISTERGRSSS